MGFFLVEKTKNMIDLFYACILLCISLKWMNGEYVETNEAKKDKIDHITLKLNSLLETMILKKPEQWIWTHNRWK